MAWIQRAYPLCKTRHLQVRIRSLDDIKFLYDILTNTKYSVKAPTNVAYV